MRGKRKIAEDAVEKESRRTRANGKKRPAKRPILHAAEPELPSRRRRHVSLPLVRSGQPGTVALDNAKIFEIIPFP